MNFGCMPPLPPLSEPLKFFQIRSISSKSLILWEGKKWAFSHLYKIIDYTYWKAQGNFFLDYHSKEVSSSQCHTWMRWKVSPRSRISRGVNFTDARMHCIKILKIRYCLRSLMIQWDSIILKEVPSPITVTWLAFICYCVNFLFFW